MNFLNRGISFNTKHYNKTSRFSCWIRPDAVLYAVLIPVTFMLINSAGTFLIFCLRMFPNFCLSRRLQKSSTVRMSSGVRKKRQDHLHLFVTLIFTQFLLGLPWVSLLFSLVSSLFSLKPIVSLNTLF